MGRRRRTSKRAPIRLQTHPTHDLRRALFRPKPRNERRRYWGRSVDLTQIERAIRAANAGHMRDLTDLARESASLDGHLSAVLSKRLNGLAALECDIVPAAGEGIEPERAQRYADVVREQIDALPCFHDRVGDLAWGLFDGRAALEIHWEGPLPGPVRWRVRNLSWVHARRLSFGPERELRIVDAPYTSDGFAEAGIALRDQPHKFITFTPRLFGDYPEREGLAPRALYWAFFKRFGVRERLTLLELFGKPWRIVQIDRDATPSADDIDAADQFVDSIGAQTSGRLPAGMSLVVNQPNATAGQVHGDVVKQSNEEMSKLVLGQTGTTDSQPSGLNSGAAYVHQDAEWLVRASDARLLSGAFEDALTRSIVVLNFGEAAVSHAPRFRLRSEPPADRTQQIDRVDRAVKAGLSIRIEEAYEHAGFAVPDDGDTVLKITQPESAEAEAPRARIVYPSGHAPAPGELAPLPDDSGLSGLIGDWEPSEPTPALSAHIRCAAQPETVNGSPEALITSGADAGARITRDWASTLTTATAGVSNPATIYERLNLTWSTLDVDALASDIHARILHSAMLGMLDARWERETGKTIAPARFGADGARFVHKPFEQALAEFLKLDIVPKDTFERLSRSAKKRAFTVARMASMNMLKATHRELARLLREQTSLREFQRFALEQLESSGWSPASPSHVETIYRTNLVNAHASGRFVEMSQPEVRKALAYWQIQTVNDGPPRQRDAHRDVHGWVLRADDPAWSRIYPPFGFNCRCRVVARSERWVTGRGVAVRRGSEIQGLPDRGFASGTGALILP